VHSNPNIWLILLLGGCLLAPVNAQTTEPKGANTVTFHEPKRLESAPQPPADLRQVTVELLGTLIGQPPNISIEFVLALQNNGPQEVKILNPLDTLSLQFSTIDKKLIPVPERVSKLLPQVAQPKDAIPGTKRDAPYPAPVQFRQITSISGASSQKEDTITIPSGANVQIFFESEPVVMGRVVESLRTETGKSARSFKAKAFLALISAPPQTGGRSLYSDPVLLTIPSLH